MPRGELAPSTLVVPPHEIDHPIVLHPIATTARTEPAGAAHPALREFGEQARRYVRDRRRKRRLQLSQRFASVTLGIGVLAAVPTLSLASGPKAPAPAPPAAKPRVLPAAATPLQGAAKQAFTARETVAAAKFPGAYVLRDGGALFISYPVDPNQPFLRCTRSFESDTAGGYRAINPTRVFFGAYQFRLGTWDEVARQVGRYDLVGVNPVDALPADQDFLAYYLYKWYGASPWVGRCAGL